MSVTRKIKKYGCIKCGKAFEFHPPDDLHITASRKEGECEARGAVKTEYICENCGTKNTIYWCRKHKFPSWYA